MIPKNLTYSIFLFLILAAGITVPGQRRLADLLITGGTVVTMDQSRRVIGNGAVAIKGGEIVAVGDSAVISRRCTARQTISARCKVVIPGLINTHTHFPTSLFCGI